MKEYAGASEDGGKKEILRIHPMGSVPTSTSDHVKSQPKSRGPRSHMPSHTRKGLTSVTLL